MPTNALAPPARNAMLRPYPPSRPRDLNYYGILAEAQKMFPFINQYDPRIKVSPRRDAGYAETFGPREEGGGNFPRPKEFPMGSTGIEVYKPDQFSPSDFAAEYLHVDPRAHQTRAALLKTFTPDQLDQMRREPDYTDSIGKYRMSEAQAMSNMTDSVMRGYLFHQWPQRVIDGFGFTPQQRQMLDSLSEYTRAVPSSGKMR